MAIGLAVLHQPGFRFPDGRRRLLDPTLVLERVQLEQHLPGHHRRAVRKVLRHPQDGTPDNGPYVG